MKIKRSYHGKSGGTSSILSLHDLITTELDAVSQVLHILLGELGAGDLGQKGQDGGACVTADHSDVGVVHIHALVLRHEGVGTNHIQGGDTEQLSGVVYTVLLQGLGEDGHGGVNRVTDDQEHSIRAGLGTSLGKALDNTGIGVEQIVSGHSRLSGDSGRNHNDLATVQSVTNLFHTDMASNLSGSAAVRDIGGNTGSSHNIEKGKLSDSVVELEEKGQGLTNSTGSTHNSHLVASSAKS